MGSEMCIRDSRTVWASVSDYRPPPLTVLRNPWIQWTVLLPRELDHPHRLHLSHEPA